MISLPITLNLDQKKVLIVGGGKASLRKTKQLLERGISVVVIAPEWRAEYPNHPHLQCKTKEFSPQDLEGMELVYSYTDSADVNANVLKHCREKRILCTASHYKDISDFTSPALWKHNEVTFALSSEKGDFHKTIEWRDRIRSLLTCPPLEKGKVFLVGFGPGNPDLMTLRTHQILDQADEVFYDDLIDPEVLRLYTCKKTYVGKRKGKHYLKQEEINLLLLESARQGNLVVRLKGGDPFIFGRGGEELLYLAAQGVSCEIVPGITSALAAAASQKTPLTQRKTARSVAFHTAHHIGENPKTLPKADTLVLYMGATKLQELSERLVQEGWNPQTSVLLVQNASFPQEKAERTTIKNLMNTQLGSPLCIIIGDVVAEFTP